MYISDELGAGRFIERPNRFLVVIKTLKNERRCHLRDPGRLSELMRPNAPIVFMERKSRDRKTDCEVLLVWSGSVWVVVNSGLHNDLAEEAIRANLISELSGFHRIRREIRYGDSRIDFLLEGDKNILLEVKGCTLVEGGRAYFPDAPTERGRRHIINLIRALNNGYRAAVLFLVMRPDAESLSPNWRTDREFSSSLKKAVEMGVETYALTFAYRARHILPVSRIPVIL